MLRESRRATIVLVLGCWIGAVALSTAALLLSRVTTKPIEFELVSSEIEPELGLAFVARVRPSLPPWWSARGDSLSSPAESDLTLLENGHPLGPAHATHTAVREKGAGRFSHWVGRIIFSASDNSDPRTNGRLYRVSFSPRPAPWIERGAMLLLLVGVALTPIACRHRSRLGVRLAQVWFIASALAILLIWNLVLMWLAPRWIAVQQDSMSYLGDFSIRTIGYPLILRSVSFIWGDLRPLAFMQVNAVALSMVALAAATAHVLAPRDGRERERRPLLAAASWSAAGVLLLFMGTSTRIFETSFTVMADGPFIAVSCLVAAIIALSARHRSAWLPPLAAALIAAAILIRPVGIGLLPVVLLPWWWHRHDLGSASTAWWRPVLRLLLPALLTLGVILGAASMRNFSRHGFFGLSTMGSISLAGHVAWMVSPETVPSEPELARRIEAQVAPILEARPALGWPTGYYLHTSDEYNILLWIILAPTVDRWLAEHPPAEGTQARERERLLRVLATEPVRHRPWAYTQHVLANAFGCTHWFGRGASVRSAIEGATPGGLECLEALPPQQKALFEQWIETPMFDSNSPRSFVWERLRRGIDDRRRIYAAITAAATLLGVLLLPWGGRRAHDGSGPLTKLATSPEARLLAAFALMVWSPILLMALSATIIFRYTDALDPMLASSAVVAIFVAVRALSEVRGSFSRRNQSEKLTSDNSRSP